MPPPVTSDDLLKDRASALRAKLGQGHSLRLFKNDLAPTPATLLAAFQEADYPGYGSVSLTGVWTAVQRIQGGEYAFGAGPFTFQCTGGAGQLVYGWFLGDGVDLAFCQRFNAPILMTAGKLIKLALSPQAWSLSLFA